MEIDYQLLLGADKQTHLLSYGMLSFTLGIMVLLLSDRQLVKTRLRYTWMTIVTLGILEEYRQYFVLDRSAEFLDAIANIIGVTLGILVSLFIFHIVYNTNKFLSKSIAIYLLVLTPMLIGLLVINERPFIAFDQPIQDQFHNLFASIGL
ncbi:VanZ family protein [Halobacillus salinus]|uniref:VanZ family protein n=1 Tax=Halobacillus salinus TaxID=192814 RepID=UPI0009A84FD9|nr:VanZ family protein [Halobacillus salinus]